MKSGLKAYIENLASMASEKLSREKFEYISQGYDTGITARENEMALKRLTLSSEKQRNLDKKVRWGWLNFPIMVAPMAFHSLYDERAGEIATAHACENADVPFIVPMMSNYSLEEIARSAPRAILLFQMHICDDLEVNRELIARAQQSGYKAIVLTVDVPPLPRKQCDIKNQFTISCNPANFFVKKGAMSSKLRWQDVLAIKDYCQEMPIYLKGITSVDDALKAYEAGFHGIFISNHGGRINDDTIAAIDALLSISKMIADPNFDIFIDGGFRDGQDIQKAMAFGAKAVALGRPCAYALSVGGETCLYDLLKKIILDWQQTKLMLQEGRVAFEQEKVEAEYTQSLSARVLFNS